MALGARPGFVLGFSLGLAALSVVNAGAQVQELRWGGDAQGRAPFGEADPSDPKRIIGFEG